MKFKYVGQSGVKDLDLVVFKIKKATAIINNGDIIEIPDSEKELINRIQVNGNYEVYEEPKKVVTPKKESKPKKDKKEEKEDK